MLAAKGGPVQEASLTPPDSIWGIQSSEPVLSSVGIRWGSESA